MTPGPATPPRVLHVVESWAPVASGYASRSRWIVASQARLGVSRPAVLVSSRQHVYDAGEPDALRSVPIDACAPSASEHRWRERLPRPFRRPYHVDTDALSRAIERAADRHEADLLHVHWPSAIGVAAARGADASGLPLVAELRFDLAGAMLSQSARGRGRLVEPLARRWFERHVRRASAVVAASDALAALVRRTHRIDADGVTVVPNGIDARFAWACERAIEDRRTDAAAAAQATLDARGDARVTIGTTSRMLHYEGLDRLIAIAQALPDIDLVFIGDGPERERLTALAGPLNRVRADRVRFVGRVPAEAIPEQLAALDVFVVPRRELSITRFASPIKLIEAMAAARCCIASAVGDMQTLLSEERGVLIEPHDDDALVNAVRTLSTDPERRACLGERARRHALSTYDGDALIERYGEVYARALGRPRPQAFVGASA